MQTKLVINGRIPSKKNSKIMVCRGKFPMLLPSKNYTAWHKDASQQLMKQAMVGKFPVEDCNIEIHLVAPDKRGADLTNKAESLMDLLVDNGIIKDDNWFVVKSVLLNLVGVSKENAGATILINY